MAGSMMADSGRHRDGMFIYQHAHRLLVPSNRAKIFTLGSLFSGHGVFGQLMPMRDIATIAVQLSIAHTALPPLRRCRLTEASKEYLKHAIRHHQNSLDGLSSKPPVEGSDAD